MIDFTKKYSNTPDSANEQVTRMSEQYNAAIKRIEQLEYELSQRNEAQTIMSEGMKSCSASLFFVKNQLQTIARQLDLSNKYIIKLMQVNQALKLSTDEWTRRAIKLEFDGLTVKDELKKIENQRDLAIETIERLQVELMSAIKENNRDSH
jgi:hypothetical protein